MSQEIGCCKECDAYELARLKAIREEKTEKCAHCGETNCALNRAQVDEAKVLLCDSCYEEMQEICREYLETC